MTPTDLAGPAVPPPGPASATDVLDGAAALLRQGWVRYHFARVVDGQYCYCLSGAVRAAAGGTVTPGFVEEPYGSAAYVQARAAVETAVVERCRLLTVRVLSTFNDRTADSVDDVLAVIEAAKARLS